MMPLKKIKIFFDPNSPIALEEVVLDFETAAKNAFLHNFEGVGHLVVRSTGFNTSIATSKVFGFLLRINHIPKSRKK